MTTKNESCIFSIFNMNYFCKFVVIDFSRFRSLMKKGFTAEIINREPQFSVILHSIENLNVNERILCQVAAAIDFTPINVSLRILF